MYQPTFGKNNQVAFRNEHEYYELLGFLANSENAVSIVWEHNEEQGAWGSEGRLQFHRDNMPFSASLKMTAGVGKIKFRINCNEFVRNINKNHGFILGKIQTIATIRATIPVEFLIDFESGLIL